MKIKLIAVLFGLALVSAPAVTAMEKEKRGFNNLFTDKNILFGCVTGVKANKERGNDSVHKRYQNVSLIHHTGWNNALNRYLLFGYKAPKQFCNDLINSGHVRQLMEPCDQNENRSVYGIKNFKKVWEPRLFAACLASPRFVESSDFKSKLNEEQRKQQWNPYVKYPTYILGTTALFAGGWFAKTWWDSRGK